MVTIVILVFVIASAKKSTILGEPKTPVPALSATYISTVDWPPTVRSDAAVYSCAEAGLAEDRAGITEKRIIEGREWCRTTVNEGAAGSMYSQYAYTTMQENGMKVVTFTLRLVQCGNYDEPNRSKCETERAGFDPDSVIAGMY